MTAGTDEDRFARLHNLITDLLREMEQEYVRARQDALRDPLTGLPNRRAFEPRLDQEVSRARRYGRRLSLIMLDIDHFKTYNDLHGHRSGDDLLKQMGRLIQRELREPDMVFRIGGEEFVIILPETDLEGAVAVIRRLQDRLRRDERVGVTLSFGLAEFPTHAEDAEPLVEAADRALYEAKEAGRDTVRLPDGSVPAEAGSVPAPARGARRAGSRRAPGPSRSDLPGVPVEVGFGVDDEQPASVWLNGRVLRVHEAVAVQAGADGEAQQQVFHVRTDDGDFRLFRRDGRWYIEGRV